MTQAHVQYHPERGNRNQVSMHDLVSDQHKTFTLRFGLISVQFNIKVELRLSMHQVVPGA